MRIFLIVLITFFCMWSPVTANDVAEYRSQAARLIGDHRWLDAIDVIRKGLELDRDDPYLLITGGALYFQLGKLERANELLDRGLEREGLSPQLLRLAAGVRRGQGSLEESSYLLKRALEIDSRQAESHYEMALTAYLGGDEEEALNSAFQAVQLDGSEVRYRDFYALILDRSGRFADAYYQLRLAQRLAPHNSRILLRLADRARLQKEYSQALEYLDLAAGFDPENPLYHYERAKVLRQLNLPEEASEADQTGSQLERLLDLYLSALTLASRERYHQAREILEGPVQENSQFVRGALLLADLHHKMGEAERALQIYLMLLRQDSDLQAAREQGAWIQARGGDLDSALKLLRQGQRRSLNEILFRGHQLLQQGRWSDALTHFKTIEKAYPLDVDLLSLVSRCLSALGEMEGALDYLDRASRIDPLNPVIKSEAREVRLRQALALESRKEWDQALAAFSTLEESSPENLTIIFHLGYVFQNLGRYSEAIDRYEKGLEREPDNEWVRVNLAYCYYQMLDFASASRQWEYLVQKNSTPEYVYHLGLSRLREFRLDEAWKLIELAAHEGHEPAGALLQKRNRGTRYSVGQHSGYQSP